MTDIMTPTLGESVTEATVARWAKKAGEAVRKDEVLVELETDKVSLEVVAPEIRPFLDTRRRRLVACALAVPHIRPGSAHSSPPSARSGAAYDVEHRGSAVRGRS